MGFTESTSDAHRASTPRSTFRDEPPASVASSRSGPSVARRQRYLRSLSRTASHGLVYGLASTTGGAIVTGLIWWGQR